MYIYKSIEIGCDCVNHFLGTQHTKHIYSVIQFGRNMCTFRISKSAMRPKLMPNRAHRHSSNVYLLAEEITSPSSSSSAAASLPSSSSPKFTQLNCLIYFGACRSSHRRAASPFTFRENARCQLRRRRRLSIYLLHVRFTDDLISCGKYVKRCARPNICSVNK